VEAHGGRIGGENAWRGQHIFFTLPAGIPGKKDTP
jgi:hypothetical protein